ncbi:MAG: hypothetical protein GY868_13025 [Deltaproteobacteria bacterium]|nr:hypothetical protein [Deltaproteobacteria bacterium]
MINNIIALGILAEKMMAVTYRHLTVRFEKNAEAQKVLEGMVNDELAHALVMNKIKTLTEDLDFGMQFLEQFQQKQLAFVQQAINLTLELQEGARTTEDILNQLIGMEKSLSENLFERLINMVDEPLRTNFQKLSHESSDHEQNLKKLLQGIGE